MEPARSVSRLAQRERGKPEELATRDGPERLDERRERGRASGEAADDRSATRERSHASDGAGGRPRGGGVGEGRGRGGGWGGGAPPQEGRGPGGDGAPAAGPGPPPFGRPWWPRAS